MTSRKWRNVDGSRTLGSICYMYNISYTLGK
nr:MAG TPA: hypothetical protein [Caudoviricetes sp.]